MIGKYVWNVARKADNLWLWVKWVDHVYMRGRNWWSYTPKSTTSWYWKQVCKVKDALKTSFLQNGWMITGYKAKLAYQWLRPAHAHGCWDKWVWNRLSIPRHRFTTWLYMWRRLNTRDRLLKHGFNTVVVCPMCMIADESHHHLFWECQYAQQVWRHVCDDLQLDRRQLNQFEEWILSPTTGVFRKRVVQTVCSATLYHLWQQRNGALWDGKLPRPRQVAERIKQEIHLRILAIMPKKTSRQDRE